MHSQSDLRFPIHNSLPVVRFDYPSAVILSRKKKLLFAVCTVCGFFVLLECVFALFGIAPVTHERDPYVGFSASFPLMEEHVDEDGHVIMRTAENKLDLFNDQSFSQQKPADTLRVFCLGGSTTYGRPYHDPTSFAGWLRSYLPAASPDQPVEVINAGGVSYASYRVAAVMREMLQYEPDLFIIYSGHNEFLERRTYAGTFEESPLQRRVTSILSRTRVWTVMQNVVSHGAVGAGPTGASDVLPGEVNEMLNHTVGPTDYHRDDTWRHQVVQHFEFNLRRMIRMARSAEAEVLLITPASNLKDCSPFKSEYVDTLDVQQIQSLKELLSESDELTRDGQPEQALSLLSLAEEIDDRVADLQFQKGRAQFVAGQFGSAHESFVRAVNEDVCPLRAVNEIVNAVRDIAATAKCPLIDYEHELRDRCQVQYGHQCVGEEYFFDHVHPRINEHRRLALLILSKLDAIGFLKTSAEFTSERVQQITDTVLGDVDQQEQGAALRNLAKVFHWSGKFPEALSLAQQALELIDDDLASMFVAAECERMAGQDDRAIDYYQRILQKEAFYWRARQPLGRLLAARGDYTDAALHFSIAVRMWPDDPVTHQDLGVVLYRLGEYDDAIMHLERANQLQANDVQTLYYLAYAKLARQSPSNKTRDEIIRLFQKLLALDPQDAESHHQLGVLLRDANRKQAAIDSFRAALDLDPDLPAAKEDLRALNAD